MESAVRSAPKTSFARSASLGILLAVLFGIVAHADNFNERADKNGCDSIVTESGRNECSDAQRRKNEACNVGFDCDLDKQQRTIENYKDAKERLDKGQVADADKDKLKDTVRALKDDLDQRKDQARRNTGLADACVQRREEVQRWFEEKAIPITEHARDDALRERKDLLDKLADAQRKVREAKDKRDAKPGDSSAQSDYDHAVDDLRAVEKMLEDLNKKYGPEIEKNAEKLVRQYKDGKSSHEKPLAEARARRDKCKQLDDLSY